MDRPCALPAFLRAAAASLAAVAAGGCATENNFNSVYSIVPAYHLVTSRDAYTIYDRPDLQRVAITPSRDTAIEAHLINHIPFDLANLQGSRSPGSDYVIPLQQYFQATGRRCQLTNGYVLMTPQWEFAYECQPGTFEPQQVASPFEPYK
jgi:hypothetical protein